MRNIWRNAILGVACADAVGVPVEFVARAELAQDPVEGMRAYGTHGQPAGTWSDDTSLNLATVDSLLQCKGVEYGDMMERFSQWALYGDYSPFGECFDIGISTSHAIMDYGRGKEPILCGGEQESDNGNGSLMRIMPICVYSVVKGLESQQAIEYVHYASALTHRHARSQIGCGIYFFCVKNIINSSAGLRERLQAGISEAMDFYRDSEELAHYSRIADVGAWGETDVDEVFSTGYVVHTLEAAIWCLVNTKTYEDAILRAVNLGDDTDTVAAVVGGLAGLYYCAEAIPAEWIATLQRRDMLENFAKEINEIQQP